MSEDMLEMLKTLRGQIKEDTERSLKQVEENITHRIYEKIEEKFCNFETDITEIKKKQEEQERRLDDLDRKQRHRNLIFFGIAEEEHNYSELEDLMIGIINHNMEVECNKNDIEFVGRMGKKNAKPRPIRLALTTYGKKIAILKQKPKENTQWYIKEDFSPKILQKRKELQEEVKKLRDEGVKAVIKYDKIITLNDTTPKKNTQTNNKRKLSITPEEKGGHTNAEQKKPYKQIQKNTGSHSITSYMHKPSKQQTKPLHKQTARTNNLNDKTETQTKN